MLQPMPLRKASPLGHRDFCMSQFQAPTSPCGFVPTSGPATDLYDLNCPDVAWGLGLLSDIVSTKLSVVVALRYFLTI